MCLDNSDRRKSVAVDLAAGKLYQSEFAGFEVEHGIRPRFKLQPAERARIVDPRGALHLISSAVGVSVKNVPMRAGVN